MGGLLIRCGCGWCCSGWFDMVFVGRKVKIVFFVSCLMVCVL